MRTLREIYEHFPASAERGLGHDEVAQSLARYGANRLTPLPREPLWKKFLGKFDEPIIKILLAATLLKTVVDLFEPPGPWGLIGLGLVVATFIAAFALKLREWLPSMMFGTAVVLVLLSIISGHPSYEGLAVMVAVMLATGVAFASEYKSDREFEVLNAQKESLRAKVLRHGEVHAVPLEEVVVGDLIVLEMGDEIPADGRTIKAKELYLDQSLMTGESEPVRKLVRPADDTSDGPDQPGCLYRGTQVVDGAGQMVVTEVGDLTMIGQIARRLSADEPENDEPAAPSADSEEARIKRKLTISKEKTPLQVKLTALAGMISKVGYVAAVAIFLALLIRGTLFTDEVRFTPEFVVNPETGEYVTDAAGNRVTDPALGSRETTGQALRDSRSAILGYFVYMVIVIVVAVPEGLPMSVTVSLALAMRKMTRANSLVRQLVACETIGSATVICADKTGTLTQNKMQVDRVWMDGELHERGRNWPAIDQRADWPRERRPIDWIAINAALNTTANLEKKDGRMVPVGSSTEGALLQWLHENGVAYQQLRLQFPSAYQIHFSSERKHMTTVVRYGGRIAALVKGAPEVIVQMSSHYLAADGSVKPCNDAAMSSLLSALRKTSGEAMRSLAFAYKLLPADMPVEVEGINERRSDLEAGYVFAGFVGIRDPLRDDVKESLRLCREAGIEFKMITGDNVDTARAIATEAGVLDRPDAAVLTHDEFAAMSNEQLKDVMPRMRVLARARPM